MLLPGSTVHLTGHTELWMASISKGHAHQLRCPRGRMNGSALQGSLAIAWLMLSLNPQFPKIHTRRKIQNWRWIRWGERKTRTATLHETKNNINTKTNTGHMLVKEDPQLALSRLSRSQRKMETWPSHKSWCPQDTTSSSLRNSTIPDTQARTKVS